MTCKGCEHFQRAIVFKKVGIIRRKYIADIVCSCTLNGKRLKEEDIGAGCEDYEKKEEVW